MCLGLVSPSLFFNLLSVNNCTYVFPHTFIAVELIPIRRTRLDTIRTKAVYMVVHGRRNTAAYDIENVLDRSIEQIDDFPVVARASFFNAV